jgi:hypothetical protein
MESKRKHRLSPRIKYFKTHYDNWNSVNGCFLFVVLNCELSSLRGSEASAAIFNLDEPILYYEGLLRTSQ